MGTRFHIYDNGLNPLKTQDISKIREWFGWIIY